MGGRQVVGNEVKAIREWDPGVGGGQSVNLKKPLDFDLNKIRNQQRDQEGRPGSALALRF